MYEREMASHYRIPADRNLTGENLEILMKSLFSKMAAERAGFNVFSSHYNFTNPEQPTRELTRISEPRSAQAAGVPARNIVLINPLRMGGAHQDQVRSGEIQMAIGLAKSSLPEGVNPESLEFIIPIQVAANHWVLATLTPAEGRYHLNFVDSLYNPTADRDARIRLAQENGYSEEEISRIRLEPSDNCKKLVKALKGLIASATDLSCSQQTFAKSEGLGDGRAPKDKRYNDHYWSCGLITAENAVNLALYNTIFPPEKYTANSKERMFERAQKSLRMEALSLGIIDDEPEATSSQEQKPSHASKVRRDDKKPATSSHEPESSYVDIEAARGKEVYVVSPKKGWRCC